MTFAFYILENFPEKRKKWQERLQYVMVDEFQDVSAKQYKIARILSAKHKNLFITGDSDQTIYSWRGSHVKLILDFDKKYPDAKTVVLKQNYRSTPQILAAANELISKNTVRYPKELVPLCADGRKPLYFHAADAQKEAEWICKEIKRLVSSEDNVNLRDVAVLYRAHYLSRALEEELVRKNLPYRILSGTEFYGRREIKDTICYLRMLTAADDMAFYRTINMPSRKIGKQKLSIQLSLSVETVEGLKWHKYFAPNFEILRPAVPLKCFRDISNTTDIRCNVISDNSVSTCEGAIQFSVLVGQTNCRAVKFKFAAPGEGGIQRL